MRCELRGDMCRTSPTCQLIASTCVRGKRVAQGRLESGHESRCSPCQPGSTSYKQDTSVDLGLILR